MHPDGNRIALAPVQSQDERKPDQIIFIVNFFDELRRIAPAKK